eukprot:scaffold160960_cov29-Prasinocladus_malaysianus.AAC.2
MDSGALAWPYPPRLTSNASAMPSVRMSAGCREPLGHSTDHSAASHRRKRACKAHFTESDT